MYSTKDHTIPFSIAFGDKEKTIDSVQTKAVLSSLHEQGIEDVYVKLEKASSSTAR